MARLDVLLKLTVSEGASDLHITSGEIPRIRVDGELLRVKQPALSQKETQELLFELLTEEECQRFLAHRNLDKSYSLHSVGNFRCNFFMTRKGVGAVFRLIPAKMPKFETVGAPQAIQDLAMVGKGLILITGPTGSGKSTTLAALIDYMNENFNYHILTVEDPIEFIHESKASLINQREIGNSCLSFADALKYALREDPDVILVGELRDLETIALALTAAETGHLVLGTLHTRGAAEAVNRIIDSFSAGQQAMIRTMLSESLVAVVSQALLRKAEGKGRIPAFEVMIANGAISNLIREGKTFQISSAMQTGKKEGMVLMDDYIAGLYKKGLVTAEEAISFMENPSILGPSAARAIRAVETKGSAAVNSVPIAAPEFAPPTATSVATHAPRVASTTPSRPAPSPAPTWDAVLDEVELSSEGTGANIAAEVPGSLELNEDSVIVPVSDLEVAKPAVPVVPIKPAPLLNDLVNSDLEIELPSREELLEREIPHLEIAQPKKKMPAPPPLKKKAV